jgi:mono/diheme cytochrome c family protein
MAEGVRCWVGVAIAVLVTLGVAHAAGASDGAALFADLCASCHGADARGLDGRPDIHCHRNVSGAVREGRTGTAGSMPPLPDLTDADLARLQEYLRTLCPAPDGARLYDTHCACCHGPAGDGTTRAPAVHCALRVRDAVRRGRDTAMPPLPGLTDAEVDQVQVYLDRRCAARGRKIGDVYAANCATCHGRDGTGGRDARWIEGPDIRCTVRADFVQAVTQGQGGMPAFPQLAEVMGALRRQARGAHRCP